ncbi:hypothetical protein IMG5_111080 [Ichthyophthirius multifiliis]|uniref:Uncharacterized protein n=1 Tax=Ichthyophthirius multifiliis TaxID=5932 RepID=G0QTS3_ICHMU|nr:hypothetical protein IMG5_111080 [Ichthyophthirius multifiliis]EGR31373.1 hypothetical protein IMG5_111080 [Ichthyophthirius multifiliis]|eukprot:XP_004034859.1 hypothetical protein IMG5_111080 [Ichthyophthirius multifiliis]
MEDNLMHQHRVEIQIIILKAQIIILSNSQMYGVDFSLTLFQKKNNQNEKYKQQILNL